MERKIKVMLLNVAVPTFCFILLGALLIGGFILQPNNTLFTFTIFGFAAILFYNLLIQYGIKSFILLGLLYTLLLNKHLIHLSNLFGMQLQILNKCGFGILKTFLILNLKSNSKRNSVYKARIEYSCICGK